MLDLLLREEMGATQAAVSLDKPRQPVSSQNVEDFFDFGADTDTP